MTGFVLRLYLHQPPLALSGQVWHLRDVAASCEARTLPRLCWHFIQGFPLRRRSGQGRPSGLLKGHPAKLLKSSRVKPSGAVFDRTKLRDMYKSRMQCETPHRLRLLPGSGLVEAML